MIICTGSARNYADNIVFERVYCEDIGENNIRGGRAKPFFDGAALVALEQILLVGSNAVQMAGNVPLRNAIERLGSAGVDSICQPKNLGCISKPFCYFWH